MWGRQNLWNVELRRQKVSQEVENAMKKRMSVKVDGCEMWGWIAPAKWRAELGISDWSDEQAKGKMAIQFDNGDQWRVELRGSGQIKDCKKSKS